MQGSFRDIIACKCRNRPDKPFLNLTDESIVPSGRLMITLFQNILLKDSLIEIAQMHEEDRR